MLIADDSEAKTIGGGLGDILGVGGIQLGTDLHAFAMQVFGLLGPLRVELCGIWSANGVLVYGVTRDEIEIINKFQTFVPVNFFYIANDPPPSN